MPPFEKVIRVVRSCGAGVLDLLLPGVCLGCGERPPEQGELCAQCNVKLLALVAMPYCRRCGTSLGPSVPEHFESCAACPATLPRFAQVIRLGSYADPLRSGIRELKYHRQDGLRARLGDMLAVAVKGRCQAPLDLVLPVPMHWRRRLGRGTDHAMLLARTLGRGLDLPVGDELYRARHCPPQAHLSRTRRIENVRGAFAVRHAKSLAGANILLVDDVTTTGATANEAARALLAAGASSVTLAVIAKADPPKAYAEVRTTG